MSSIISGYSYWRVVWHPATGKEISYSGINIFRVADGKLAESWDLFDRLWHWQQLGVLADTAEFLAQARTAHSKQNEG